MDQMVSDRSREGHLECIVHLERIVEALGTGIILLDSQRQIVWMDRRTRTRLNGGAKELASTLRTLDGQDEINCCVRAADVDLNGETATVCVIRESEIQKEQSLDVVAAVEAALADTSSWFTRTVLERLKALRQTTHLAPRTSDLEALTDREREVLALICEGRSDAQMGVMLKLSQNTVRNHIASLYRKIGVNRRSAAIIWARERGITPQDALVTRRRARPNSLQQ